MQEFKRMSKHCREAKLTLSLAWLDLEVLFHVDIHMNSSNVYSFTKMLLKQCYTSRTNIWIFWKHKHVKTPLHMKCPRTYRPFWMPTKTDHNSSFSFLLFAFINSMLINISKQSKQKHVTLIDFIPFTEYDFHSLFSLPSDWLLWAI